MLDRLFPEAPTLRENWEKWQDLQQTVSEFRGPCRECRYFKYQEYSPSQCRHPVNCVPSLNPLHGDLDYPKVECKDARAEGSACGPAGNLFEPWSWQEVAWRRTKKVLIVLLVLALVVGVATCAALVGPK